MLFRRRHHFRRHRFWRRILDLLGPGLITGAADDDPSGIATYSQAGAQFGFGMCWVMLFTWPLMAAIQEVSARLGRVTGKGIAANLRRHYPTPVPQAIVVLLLFANFINLGADLGAMGDALRLLVGGPRGLYVILFAAFCSVIEIYASYRRYVKFLKWMTLSLFAYVGAALVVDIPWDEVVRNIFIPHILWEQDYIVVIVAVLGTTISPYLFFWQASEEAEDERIDPAKRPLLEMPEEGDKEMRRIEFDTYVGMGFSNLIALFIIITTAATLHLHGITDIQTSEQAAQALRPIAGNFAFFVFAIGILGTGLLAIPVLAGSSAYALSETMQWSAGLGYHVREAKHFYAIIVAGTLVGVGINFIDIDPLKALFWAAVINGAVAVPVMVMMMLLAGRRDIMGEFALSGWLRGVGWLSTAAMAVAVVVMFVTWSG
jgi:NRAMP (natural resistance-associated macrophage protein)-like metal ion transporter